jgi:hypothetical protein
MTNTQKGWRRNADEKTEGDEGTKCVKIKEYGGEELF